ncbi:MAG: DUF268 domain-containing protein [Myxococcaceae bacterium]|nr:MAG: DUF268 domain-containing protein [Myxococcaceae bacterium]
MSTSAGFRRALKSGLQAAGLLDLAKLGLHASSLVLDLRRLPSTVTSLPWFVRTWRQYEALGGDGLKLRDAQPCLTDRGESAGAASGHYFHQDLWAARKVHASGAAEHVDVGSRVDGFVAHVASFTEVVYVDLRPLQASGHPHIKARVGTVLSLPFADRSVPSLSCLHVIEHIGLGRYGDPLDPDGSLKALAELQRVVAQGGDFYLGVPIGRERVCFNAHRVLSPQTVLRALGELSLVEFSAVNDAGDLVRDARPEDFSQADYSCGLFHFTRR